MVNLGEKDFLYSIIHHNKTKEKKGGEKMRETKVTFEFSTGPLFESVKVTFKC